MPQPGPQPRPIIPPPPTQGNGFGAGLSQFIEAYKGERQSKKQQAAANFDKHLALLQQGLPGVNLKMMAKWAREAGLEFDYESPAPPPQPQAQAPQGPSAPQGPQGMPPALAARMAGPGGGMPPGAAPGMPMGGMPGRPPQQAPRPPQPQGGPPPGMMPQGAPPQAAGGSGRGGIFKRLGAAMGVPQPPTASQQQGAMAMLQEMKKRGQMSSEMSQMEQGIQREVLSLSQDLNARLKAGESMESPSIMQAMARLQMLTKGGLDGQAGNAASTAMAEKMFPELMKRAGQAKAAEAKAEARQSYRKTVAAKLDPDQAIAAESWVFGETDQAPEFATVDSAKLNEATVKLTSEYPGAEPEKIKAAALLMFSKDADPAELSSAFKGLGESVSQTRINIAKQNAELAQKSGARADEALGRTRRKDAEEAEVSMAVGQILQLAGNDPDAAYDNAGNLAFAAFGGDRKKATKHLAEIQKMLKGLSKNPDWMEKLMSEAGAAGARAAMDQ